MKKVIVFATVLSLGLSGVVNISGQRQLDRSRQKLTISDEANTKDRSVQPIEQTRFESISALTTGKGVYVRWQMAIEKNSLGFEVFRIDESGKHLVSPEVIGGSSLIYGSETARGLEYGFYDESGNKRSVYTIENIGNNGSRILSNTVSVNVVNDLSNIANNDIYGQRARSSERHLRSSVLELNKELSNEVEENAIVADPSTHAWVLSRPGVRVEVNKEGLYRITRTQLQNAGFNVDADPAMWALYDSGVEQSITVGSKDDYIEFYGRPVNTPESSTKVYYLINSDVPGKRIETKLVRPGTSTVVSPTYRQTYKLVERTNYTNNIRNGDAENFWGRIIAASTTTLNFNLTGVDLAQPTVNILLKFQGFSTGMHSVEVTLNGNVLNQGNGSGHTPFSVQQTIPGSYLREGANSIQFRSVGPTGDSSFFDTMEIDHKRRYVASQNKLSFYTENNRAAKLTGFGSSDVRLFDIAKESAPTEFLNVPVVQEGDNFSVDLPAARGRVFYAATDANLLSPVSITPFDTAFLGASNNAADMVIISHRNWMAESETWAQYRRGQGYTVKVVDVSEVFDEFSYGVSSSEAIKLFLQYAYNSWQTAPQYALLMGDAYLDPKNYLNIGTFNYIPTRSIVTIFNETPSDEFLADFNNDGLAEIAVGRIPARSGADVTAAYNKAVHFEANLASIDRGFLFVHDLPDGYDFQGMSGRIRDQLPSGTPNVLIGRGDTNAQAAVVNSINAGKYAVNYAGHGTTGGWASLQFFTIFNVTCTNGATNCVNNIGNESLFTMLTCLNGFFINVQNDSLAETLLFTPNGGAAAAWASTGLTTPDIQEVMAQRFYNRLGAGTIPRLGDLIKDAKTTIPGGMDVRLSWALIGDPLLKVR